jgi:hypothetical protein
MIGLHPPPVTTIWVDVLYSSGKINRLALLPSDPTIEAGIIREFGDDSYAPADASLLPDRLVTAGVLRLAVNAMLLLTEFGCKRLGPANQSHYQRLERHVLVARKTGQGLDEARRNLRLVPQLFALPHDIVLYEREGRPDSGSHADSPSHRRPHWRRGHWKMHAHGPGRGQRKRIFIPPTLVNRKLLCGEELAGDVVYHLR